MRPPQVPIGLQLSRTARVVSRAFDEELARVGGSLPVWLVLLNVKINRSGNQRQLAESVGVTEATLTHHLNAMERDGLLERSRDPSNRRNHVIDLTQAGEQAFARLRAAANAFDQRLRQDLGRDDMDALHALLDQLVMNVAGADAALPWPGLVGGRPGRTSG